MVRWKRTLSRRRLRRTRGLRLQGATRSKKIALLSRYAFLGVALLVVVSFIAIPLFAFNLPSPDKIVRRDGFSTKILDRNGEVLYDIFVDERRTPVDLEEIPLFLRQATIAIEDKNFYEHKGFDPTGLFRAMFNIGFRGRL